MPDVDPGSKALLDKLGTELDKRHERLSLYDNYYRGNHELTFASRKFRSAFGSTFKKFAVNFCELVVDAVEERLHVEGFRIQDERGDQDAWRIWQDNNLDAESQLAHTEALVKEQAYALVWRNGESAEITIEDPLMTVVAFSKTNRRNRVAGLKRWIDDSGFLFATLYLPGRIEKYRTTKKVDPSFRIQDSKQLIWEVREVPGEAWPLNNPLNEVPLIPLTNRPRLDGCGSSEIASVIPLNDALNKVATDLLVAAEYGAFRQRWATGIEIPRDPQTNEPIEPFKAAVDRLWAVEADEATFGEFSQTDLGPYVKAAEMYVQQIASITKTPPHYLLGQAGSFPSGESLKATETGLVAKARRKMRHFGESWEAVMRLAFLVLDDPRGKVTNAETLWRDPESRTESEHIDAVLKMQAMGVPNEFLWERAGFSETEIQRIKKMRAAEALEVGSAFDPFRQMPDAGEPAVTQN